MVPQSVKRLSFIGLSPVNGSMEDDAYEGKLEWAEEEIQKAIAAAPSRPVFVITHNNPKDTVYTSDDYGDSKLDALFAKYPQVISISGHTHASILDERSISQTSYTAINTQSLSYTDFEEGALLEEPGRCGGESHVHDYGDCGQPDHDPPL